MSLVPIAALGERYGVSVRGIDSIVRLACIIHRTDYWRRTAGRPDKLGNHQLSVGELTQWVMEGACTPGGHSKVRIFHSVALRLLDHDQRKESTMTAIAGIMGTGEFARVAEMLDQLSHRGEAGRTIAEAGRATIGVTWQPGEPNPTEELERRYPRPGRRWSPG